MIIETRNPELVASLRPRDLISYLRAQGWAKVDERPGRYVVWSPPVGDGAAADVQLLVPLSRDFRDYALRVGDALALLSDVEERTVSAILSDVRHSTADVVRLRLLEPRTAGGEIPVKEAADLISAARDLLLAAACAAVAPRPVFHTRKPPQAVAYVEGVRMGQTERGSFVVTIVSDLPPPVGQRTLDAETFDEEPFARQATRTLHRGLSGALRASEAAISSGGLEAFDQAVEDGVSANLCDALAATGEEATTALDVAFSWAVSRPEHVKGKPSVRFTSDHIEVVAEAGKHLKRRGPFEDVTLLGTVERLQREQGEDEGDITLSTLVFERPARVRIELDAHNYGHAIQAHRDRQAVRCTGTLDREGRQWVLRNPGPLEVINPPD